MSQDPIKQEARSQFSHGRSIFNSMMPLQLFISAFERGVHWYKNQKEREKELPPAISLARVAEVPEMSLWLEKLFIWADAYYYENQKSEITHVFEEKMDRTHFENIESRLNECLNEIKRIREEIREAKDLDKKGQKSKESKDDL